MQETTEHVNHNGRSPLILVRGLEKTYYSEGVPTPVLHGLTFSVESGEFVAIMGPSGSGKSTLLHILGFLDEPTGGQYLFESKTVEEYSPTELAHVRNERMGFIFQAFNLLPRMAILENVRLPLLYSNISPREWDERAQKALEAVGLSHRLSFEPSQLSGGEKQRVAIARSLVTNPSVIFADEPTGNLDSRSGQAVMEILEKLNTEDKHTIILITHETYTAEHAARVINIKDGLIESDRRVDHRLNAHENFVK